MASVGSQLIEKVTAHAQSDNLEDAREMCADGTYFPNNLRIYTPVAGVLHQPKWKWSFFRLVFSRLIPPPKHWYLHTVSTLSLACFYIDVLCPFQLLDLFSLDDKKKDSQKSSKNQPVASGALTMKTVLETLPDLWEEKQYDEEYDLTNFMKNLRNWVIGTGFNLLPCVVYIAWICRLVV